MNSRENKAMFRAQPQNKLTSPQSSTKPKAPFVLARRNFSECISSQTPEGHTRKIREFYINYHCILIYKHLFVPAKEFMGVQNFYHHKNTEAIRVHEREAVSHAGFFKKNNPQALKYIIILALRILSFEKAHLIECSLHIHSITHLRILLGLPGHLIHSAPETALQ